MYFFTFGEDVVFLISLIFINVYQPNSLLRYVEFDVIMCIDICVGNLTTPIE